MRRILRVTFGFVLLISGLILAVPGIPGPGLPLAVAGLILLSRHYHWARRALDWVKRKTGWGRQKTVGSES